MRGRCLYHGVDEHQMKRRSFAFAVDYIYCFRTYSVYLSLRLPAQILYAGIHLPPQREARALPRRAPKLAASERKIVTKETHQGCLSFLFKSAWRKTKLFDKLTLPFRERFLYLCKNPRARFEHGDFLYVLL